MKYKSNNNLLIMLLPVIKADYMTPLNDILPMMEDKEPPFSTGS